MLKTPGAHVLQFSQLHYLLANLKTYKCLPPFFSSSSYRFRVIQILIILPSKSRSMSRIAILEITTFNGKCRNLQKCLPHIITPALTVSEIENKNKNHLQKVGQVQIFAITSFDGKCQHLQMSSTYFWASSYRFRDLNFSMIYFKK